MKYTRVKLSSLTTSMQCAETIEKIRQEPDNHLGDWYSGKETPLKPGAKKVIAKLEARSWRLYKQECPVKDCPKCLADGEQACMCW